MNYLKQIEAFYIKQLLNPLSTGEIALWHALMYIDNKTGWNEWFTVANITLQSLSALSRSGINKDRNVLKQNGYIDFKTRGTKATSYKIIDLTMSYSNQVSNQMCTQGGNQDSNQKCTQDSSALVKQDKTKQNNNTIGQNGNDKTKKTSKPKINSKQVESDFEKLWKLYPKKKGKPIALKAYKKAVKDGTTPKEVQQGIVNYLAEIKAKQTDESFVKYGSTFFNQRAWEDDFDTKPIQPTKGLNVRETLPDWAQEDYEPNQPNDVEKHKTSDVDQLLKEFNERKN